MLFKRCTAFSDLLQEVIIGDLLQEVIFARYEGFVQNIKLGNEELRRRKNISGTGNSKYTSP